MFCCDYFIWNGFFWKEISLQNCPYTEKLKKNKENEIKTSHLLSNCLSCSATYFCKFWQKRNQQETQGKQTAPEHRSLELHG